MSRELPLPGLPLSDVAQQCKTETDHYFQRTDFDPRYCYELFRRALAERVEQAWTLIYTQYTALVLGWVLQHTALASADEEAQYFVNRAFEKMWRALSPHRFAHFPDLKSLLKYLQMCVHSVITDHLRAAPPTLDAQPLVADLPQAHLPDNLSNDLSGDLSGNLWREEFWALVQKRLKSEEERLVIYYRFIQGMPPRAICQSFPEIFPNTETINLVQQNVISRLRRDPDLRKFIQENA
jgi:DNA-directed RNA polymerase specialized sigma24 family protein